MIRRRASYRAVRAHGGPISDDAHHDPPVRPQQPPLPVPALDALTLLFSWRRARMNGDRANADKLLAELERLAERPRRKEGEHDEVK